MQNSWVLNRFSRQRLSVTWDECVTEGVGAYGVAFFMCWRTISLRSIRAAGAGYFSALNTPRHSAVGGDIPHIKKNMTESRLVRMFVGHDDALHKRMPDDIHFVEGDDGNAVDVSKDFDGLLQTRECVAGEICLCEVAGHDSF